MVVTAKRKRKVPADSKKMEGKKLTSLANNY